MEKVLEGLVKNWGKVMFFIALPLRSRMYQQKRSMRAVKMLLVRTAWIIGFQAVAPEIWQRTDLFVISPQIVSKY